MDGAAMGRTTPNIHSAQLRKGLPARYGKENHLRVARSALYIPSAFRARERYSLQI